MTENNTLKNRITVGTVKIPFVISDIYIMSNDKMIKEPSIEWQSWLFETNEQYDIINHDDEFYAIFHNDLDRYGLISAEDLIENFGIQLFYYSACPSTGMHWESEYFFTEEDCVKAAQEEAKEKFDSELSIVFYPLTTKIEELLKDNKQFKLFTEGIEWEHSYYSIGNHEE